MRYLKESAIIFAITLAGELLNHTLPLPVPAGVYGLFLMLILLCSGLLKLKDIEATGNFLLDIMPVMFIPASVGLIESYQQLESVLIPILATTVISTVIVMAVTGKVAEAMLKRKKGGGQS